MIILFSFATTIDTIRAVIGPLPKAVCKVGIFTKNIFFTNTAQNVMAMTIFKYIFVVVYRSIPIMDDNFLSTYLIISINMISIISSLVRMVAPGRPILNELVCTGQFYHQWHQEPEAFQPFNYISGICFLVHVVLTFRIRMIQKKRASSPNPNVNLGDRVYRGFIMFLILIGMVTVAKVNKTNPEDLTKYPNFLLLYFNYFFVQVGCFSLICFLFFAKNQALRRSLSKNINQLLQKNVK